MRVVALADVLVIEIHPDSAGPVDLLVRVSGSHGECAIGILGQLDGYACLLGAVTPNRVRPREILVAIFASTPPTPDGKGRRTLVGCQAG